MCNSNYYSSDTGSTDGDLRLHENETTTYVRLSVNVTKDAYFVHMYAASSSNGNNVTLINGPVGTNSSGLSSVQEGGVCVRTRKDPLQHVQNQAHDIASSDMGLQHTYATIEPPSPINMKNHPSETYFKEGNI